MLTTSQAIQAPPSVNGWMLVHPFRRSVSCGEGERSQAPRHNLEALMHTACSLYRSRGGQETRQRTISIARRPRLPYRVQARSRLLLLRKQASRWGPTHWRREGWRGGSCRTCPPARSGTRRPEDPARWPHRSSRGRRKQRRRLPPEEGNKRRTHVSHHGGINRGTFQQSCCRETSQKLSTLVCRLDAVQYDTGHNLP